ncbi:hypothetical protein PVAG01_10647 [Phlyctema vagabunda]|uniref:non-specific serine/threonine protein kinase n=1 Tax=Phlyctema vagabunda TaxID=108571 RepID=A0ABR4P388_9HELO
MEEELTQPATQIVLDPRRVGGQSPDLSSEDATDIFLMLHPSSSTAYNVCQQFPKEDSMKFLPVSSTEVRFKDTVPDDEAVPVAKKDKSANVIVLRLSANLKSGVAGHCFGRNPARCDYILGNNEAINKRVSNIHFRIYINEHGTIMIEDQSTNGTFVDKTLLRAKEKENGEHHQHIIEQGTMIRLVMQPPGEDIIFIARMPLRSDADEIVYQENLTKFLSEKAQVGVKKQDAGEPSAKEPPNLFPTQPYSSTSISRKREWRGGSTYNKIGTIGKGAFAVVYKVTRKYDGQPFAAKELEKRRFMKNGILDQKVDSEMTIMRKITHANVVQFIEHIDWDDYLYIIMEFVPGGDLGTLVAENTFLGESVVKDMASQLLSALKHLHHLGITHRDVKPDNILIMSQSPFHVKLTDFGLSKMANGEDTFLRTFCGTLLYCAPEVYSEYREYDDNGRRTMRSADRRALPPQRYGHAVDIWSLAGVLFYSLCGKPPFPVKNGTSYQELLNHIMTQALDIRPLQRVKISSHGIRFVCSMLHVRPQYRATIAQLEVSPWLTGDIVEDSIEDEDDEDQNETFREGFVDANEDLEQSASQLKLDDGEVNDSVEFNSSDDIELQRQLEIPSSFDTGSDLSEEGDSLLAQDPADQPTQARLFGEINASAVGSSGALPLSGNEFPVPFKVPFTQGYKPRMMDSDLNEQSGFSSEVQSMFSSVELSHQETQSGLPLLSSASKAMPPPPIPTFNAQIQDYDAEQRADRSSSLMGTESLVGHLRMRSPTQTPSPAAEHLESPPPDNTNNTRSLRRARESEEGEDWWPADVPAPKRYKSARIANPTLPASMYWDIKDKSTHHYNYPRLTNSEYNAFVEAATARGEIFKPGEAFFNTTMQSFRSSRSPSLEPDVQSRATSEPTAQEGRRLLMKRDDRKLGAKPFEAAQPPSDSAMPPTARGSKTNITGMHDLNKGNSAIPNLQPTIENHFQPPKRILAKFSSTKESVVQSIVLNIFDPVTSWGRGYDNTVRFHDGQQIKIPKYAFKLLIYKSGISTTSGRSIGRELWDGNPENAKDYTFYISTKATTGIWVNDINLPSHDRQNSKSESRFWGELRHGDEITVWRHDLDPSEFTRFKFECYMGRSAEVRKEQFRILPQSDLVHELDWICLVKEDEFAKEKEQKEAAAKIRKENDGQVYATDSTNPIPRNKSAPIPASRGHDVNVSFAGTPSFSEPEHKV